MRLVVEELLRSLFNTEDLTSYHNLETSLEDVTRESRTAKFCIDCLRRTVFVMMVYVRTEQEADRPLHILAIKYMMPYFFAAGHINYAHYGLYYLRSIESLPNLVLKHVMQGEHVMWNVILSDMYIETTFMRYGHGKRGINGLTLKLETLKIWGHSIHIYSRLEEDLANISSLERNEGQAKHKEEGKGIIKSDILKIEKAYEGSLRYVLTRLSLQIIHKQLSILPKGSLQGRR